MALAVGSRLAHYQVAALIGEGGMGQVYRATDTRLGRDVALKVLPDAFAADPDRLARFQREAQVLASLNHPGIAAIYGTEEDKTDGTRALVLELVEGPTLADRIAQGAIPIEDALPIATQIAEALEAAHEAGVIHRDLKPANIKVREDGTVKVLDFGLAKGFQPGGSDPSDSPTITVSATASGVIMGTAAYMSPEQAQGKPVDQRTDVWAFGAVLYEMLSGQRAFGGADVSSTLVAVLSGEVDLDALPEATPPRIRQVLRTCLRKEPTKRVHHLADVRLAMEGAFEAPVASPDTGSAGNATGVRLGIAAAVAVAVAVLVAGAFLGRAWFPGAETVPPREQTRLSMTVASGQHLSGGFGGEESEGGRQRPSRRSFVLSPDGRQLIYAAYDGETLRLYRRAMDREQATPIPGTEGGSNPFVAPDGQSVGFFVGTELRRVSIDGGDARTIATAGRVFVRQGASWTAEDTILVAAVDGIYDVPATGGSLRRLTTVDPAWIEGVRYPELLPGGRALLYNVFASEIPSDGGIVVESLETGEQRLVVEGGSDPRYVASGHIVFARRGTLMAVPFDVTRLEVTGAPVVVVEDVMQAERGLHTAYDSGAAQFSVSRSGSLAYVTGGIYPVVEMPLVWVDRNGAFDSLPLRPGHYLFPRFSPDGTRLAYSEGSKGDTHIWVYDIGLETSIPLTSVGDNWEPIWSPDGTQLAFASSAGDSADMRLFVMAADGSGEPRRLTDGDAEEQPSSWSSEGVLAFVQFKRPSDPDADIMTLSMDGESEPEPFLVSSFVEWWPTFSPDGRWLAYASNDTGRFEVYVRPFPQGEPAYRVSINGGSAPLWSPDGKQLFYLSPLGDGTWGVMVADVQTDPTFIQSRPTTLFAGPFVNSGTDPVTSYDVAPDGQRFVMVGNGPEVVAQPVTRINIVLNWVEELERLVPTN